MVDLLVLVGGGFQAETTTLYVYSLGKSATALAPHYPPPTPPWFYRPGTCVRGPQQQHLLSPLVANEVCTFTPNRGGGGGRKTCLENDQIHIMLFFMFPCIRGCGLCIFAAGTTTTSLPRIGLTPEKKNKRKSRA